MSCNGKNKNDKNKKNTFVPYDKLDKLKKYKFDIKVKKIKEGYQILIFFKLDDEYKLVYATNKKAKINIVPTEKTEYFWIFKKEYLVNTLVFNNKKQETKLYKWLKQFRNGSEMIKTLNHIKCNVDNYI